MQLRGLGHAVRQGAARNDLSRDAGGEDECPAVHVSSERRQGRAEGEERCLDINGKARVPVLDCRGVEVAVRGEARVALGGG